ncbi:MAG: DNA topoisomerase IV subunit A [Proteobacteria bacterium]|nr:DNA topoisomerase IV subunit A [Pseudomonadota bacterium]MBU4413264.1 DNA topoisomerase IV subunit A [Pseudomonadota bacterium]MCG2823093.1 DNA topoisomerase IV subunit A [Desulfobulbaceae bacterium]MDP2756007.1 DNA topoisomerase IV subunit A [Desulfurivibrionaceae bacterium]
METSHYGELHKLFDTNFLDYTSYVIRERAIPDVADGLKPVQRRILQTLFNMDDGRYHKVANVVGDCMKLHPHGDASIFSALVNLANKGYLLDRQGNFGNIFTGDQASAARYIECRLSPLARETLFNKDLTEFTESYDGRMLEPIALPAKIPLLLMQGAEGIAVGMATKIMPHNFCELLDAQKKILRGEDFVLYPDFLLGGAIDVSGYEDGNGRLRCRARIEEKNEKTITIKDIPYGTTTQSLIESVEKAARGNKLKILSINDYTAEEVEIEIKLVRGIYAADTIKALYAFTDCEMPISPNLTVILDNNPAVLTVSEVLRQNTKKLVLDLQKELTIEHGRLKEKLHAHLLEQIFIEERLYKEIEECKTYKAVVETIGAALLPFRDKLVREVTTEDIERLLEIRIKRISRYDLDKKKKDIKEVRDTIKEVENYLLDMIGYTINYLDDLLDRYGHLYPRRTEIATFGEVEVRKVALSNLTMGYDRETGFLGHQVKARPEDCFPCSEYDKLLLIYQNGMYKVINVIDKLFVGHDVLWLGKVEEKRVFNILYREGVQNLCYVKRFQSPKFILEKEYRLFPEHKNSAILFLSTGDGGRVRVHLAPSKRARHNYVDCSFSEVLIKGASALGKRVSDRPVRRIAELPAEKEPAGAPEVQPTLFPAKEGEGVPQTAGQTTEVSGPGLAESDAPETGAE